MRALDLFCCAGGATRGLQLAGFHVTGVDINPQPHYCGDAFIQGDATRPPVNLRAFDFIWASPPCQAFTPLRKLQKGKQYPNLIPATRELVASSGVPFAIENVEGAPLRGDDSHLIMLCGTMFGLRSERTELRRHRLFETSFPILLRPRCQHRLRAMTVTGHTPQTNVVRNLVRETFSVDDARALMGIDWMSMRYLSQAIPPAYAEWIGKQAIAWIALQNRSAA